MYKDSISYNEFIRDGFTDIKTDLMRQEAFEELTRSVNTSPDHQVTLTEASRDALLEYMFGAFQGGNYTEEVIAKKKEYSMDPKKKPRRK